MPDFVSPVTGAPFGADPNFPPEEGASFPAGGPGVLTRAVEDGVETWETAPPAEIVDGSVTIAKLSFDPATQAELDAHISDATAAHAASAISYVGGTGMSATDVEAAIDELATEKANQSSLDSVGASVAAVAASVTDHTSDATDAHDASAISFAPAGTIAATDAQTAIAEVATDAASALSTHAADETAVHGIADTSLVPLVNIFNVTWPTRPDAVVVFWMGGDASTDNPEANMDDQDVWYPDSE